jgi:putative flippase GtrA
MKRRMDGPIFPVRAAPSRRRSTAARSMLPPAFRVSYSNPRASGRSSRQVTLSRLLFSGRARPLRFALVGAGCGLLQLLLLVALKLAGLPGVPANVGAYLLSAQVNFVLSNRFIWHDRRASGPVGQHLAQRWLRFHASILGTFLLSQAVFILCRFLLADVVASALGIAVSGVGNFLIQDLVTFRPPLDQRRPLKTLG